ncbi:MAG: Na+/proline symporter [candidate division TA06 bacterium 32_111]|nr:MAG: Na+/proline symporter [candidate division TA06 bacterium 32_111]KUK88228.1 MAG: Na+/proline symporter [candidate division TA06 bacterium 34_109]
MISYFASKNVKGKDSFLINSRKTGLFLFIATNVSTWYGGILGVGEFTYNYGIVNWVTQGVPYYFFGFLFAILFAKRIRETSLVTISQKMEKEYGKKVSILSAVIVLILSSPAPYILMLGIIFSKIFSINLTLSMIISLVLILPFILKGGFVTDIKTDLFQFFVMFSGFILLFLFSYKNIGDLNILRESLPKEHLSFTGGLPFFYVIVWFFIASWTFVDPGFHQRCYSAKNGNTARNGILISILFWILFDFLTTTTALYSRTIFPSLQLPQWSYLFLADRIMPSGLKGLFYAAIFATVISTLNSLLVISGTTFSLDIVKKLKDGIDQKKATAWGIVISTIVGFILAIFVPSVVNLWYLIGSVCIPGLIFPLLGAYYKKVKVSKNITFFEIIFGFFVPIIWIFIRRRLDQNSTLYLVEPMFAGLIFSSILHIYGMVKNEKKKNEFD